MWITKIIKNHLCRISDKKIKKLRDIATEIKYYYIEKNKGSVESKTELSMLGITRLELNKNVLTITLIRPGLLIGSRGSNIEALQKHLNLKILIKEDLVTPNLYSYLGC